MAWKQPISVRTEAANTTPLTAQPDGSGREYWGSDTELLPGDCAMPLTDSPPARRSLPFGARPAGKPRFRANGLAAESDATELEQHGAVAQPCHAVGHGAGPVSRRAGRSGSRCGSPSRRAPPPGR